MKLFTGSIARIELAEQEQERRRELTRRAEQSTELDRKKQETVSNEEPKPKQTTSTRRKPVEEEPGVEKEYTKYTSTGLLSYKTTKFKLDMSFEAVEKRRIEAYDALHKNDKK